VRINIVGIKYDVVDTKMLMNTIDRSNLIIKCNKLVCKMMLIKVNE